MAHRYASIGLSFLAAGLLSPHSADAKECRISFVVSVSHADGTMDELCAVDPWGVQMLAVDLLPGDSLNIAWEPVACGGTVSLEVHQSPSTEPAGFGDPIVLSQAGEFNPFLLGPPPPPMRFALAGSFFIVASGTPVDFSAQIHITLTTEFSTALSELPNTASSMRYTDGAMILDTPDAGQLLVMNSAGQQVLDRRIVPADGPVRVPFMGTSGVYVASFRTAKGMRQHRFIVP